MQALTTDEDAEIPDEIPTAGQQQPPWSICPECGSSDVDVSSEGGNGKGACNACGAEYEALVKKEIEFKITKPTRSVGEETSTGAPEVPEVPALPVAAQTKLDKGSIVRVSSNQAKHGHVCPACGMKQCKASSEKEGHVEYKCPACSTDVQKDFMVNVNSPDQSYLRVKWDLVPNVEGCSGCKEAAMKFASILKIEGMIKTASNGTTKFPRANCIERVARKWGGNTVASFGPCKGKPLADCVCGQLEKLGLNKVRHLEKLAGVYAQKDPMDECIADQMKNKYARSEAVTICKCLKKKFASKEDDNAFLQAFADDIKSGKEKILTAQDMNTLQDMFSEEDDGGGSDVVTEEDVDIGAPLDAIETPEETVTIEVSEEVAQELANAAQVAVEEMTVNETPAEVPAEVAVDTEVTDNTGKDLEEETSMAIAMQTHKIVRVGEEVIKLAATPTVVKDIEGNVEAKVPRSEQKLGDESKADSLMNKPNKGPDVPRKDAYMGKEKEADSLINKELKLPDVTVDSSYMGQEKGIQKGMPAINNEIKGTVIAKEDKTVKEAKKMKEVETIEKDVEAKVPRNDQKLGEESKADSLINEPNKGPDVPRSKAYMGKEKEADSLINKDLNTPDVPIDSAYMGHEKEVQKGMPGINDEMLKTVQMKKDVQLERIATARRMKAVETAAKLLATKRINEEAYENVVEALSRFEIDKIASVADSMYPRVKKQAEAQETREVYAGPAIVMESKELKSSNPANELSKKLASSFTIGNRSFDEALTHYGEK
jgi:ketosteroid isomerase-like protein